MAKPERVDLAEPAVGVAERGGDLAHLVGRTDDTHSVTETQHEVTIDEKVGVASPNPRRHRAEAPLEVDLAQAHSGQLRLETEMRRKSSFLRSSARCRSLR